MRCIVWLLLLVVCSAFVVAENETRTRSFVGSAEIAVVQPTNTILKICTPNEKYAMEPGSTRSVRLYVRNDMENKTVKRFYIDFVADEGFSFVYAPDELLNLSPDSYQFFDINVTVADDVPMGNYNVKIIAGTDEYMIGGFEDDFLIKIRPYSDELYYVFLFIVVLIIVLVVLRFFWILNVNKRFSKRKRKKRKGISQYYYKKKK